MPIINIEITINAPIERVFDLARCIDLHEETMSKHNEKAIGGVTEGLINIGESVTWEATHFRIKQKLTSKITEFDRPHHFQDIMIEGAFKSFTHDHFFEKDEAGTIMRDVFKYSSPLWFLGKIADALFLETYMTKMLEERNDLIKTVAESEDWKKFIL
jgi:ligand-binding SRPBCC domain-containing protein